MNHFISGTFDNAAGANKAVDRIVAMDYPRDRITIIMSTQTFQRFWGRDAPRDGQIKSGDYGTVKGHANRDTIGEIVAADNAGHFTAGTGGTATRVFVAGPAAVALTNDGSPNDTPAGVLRTLSRLGMPRFDAEQLERDIDSGGIVVGVITSAGERASMERVMKTNSARNVMESMTT